MELDELRFRRMVIVSALDILDKVSDRDPRKTDALENYRKQLAIVDKRIEDKLNGIPEDTVVNLKTASIFPRAKL